MTTEEVKLSVLISVLVLETIYILADIFIFRTKKTPRAGLIDLLTNLYSNRLARADTTNLSSVFTETILLYIRRSRGNTPPAPHVPAGSSLSTASCSMCEPGERCNE